MASSRRDEKERLAFVRFWTNYMKKVPNKVWSRQQAMLVDSILESANQDIKLYMKVKRISSHGLNGVCQKNWPRSQSSPAAH